ncbi:9927_t:CDS:2, partial [Dentiscutata heterogama]
MRHFHSFLIELNKINFCLKHINLKKSNPEKDLEPNDPDSDYNKLDDDSLSSATATENLVIKNTVNNISEISNVNAIEIDNVSENNEMEPLFVWDESAFVKAKTLADEKECNYDDKIEWEDLDYESSEIALSTIKLTESLNYLLE